MGPAVVKHKKSLKKKTGEKKEDNAAWDSFVSWCLERGLTAMPANPWTLAAYARWCEPQHRVAQAAPALRRPTCLARATGRTGESL